MISLDISTLSEPLRWAFTLIGGMPPCTMIQVLRLLRRPRHTQPAKAGLVQYASYTTKCPGTTSGLSGKQATHDGVHALPPVGTGPAHKMVFARPEEWRNTFR